MNTRTRTLGQGGHGAGHDGAPRLASRVHCGSSSTFRNADRENLEILGFFWRPRGLGALLPGAPPFRHYPRIEIKANPLALSRALEVGSSGPVDSHPPLRNGKHLPYQLPYGALACRI